MRAQTASKTGSAIERPPRGLVHPNLQVRGVGGEGLKGEGMGLLRHIRDTSFMGFTQVLANMGKISKLFRDVKADVLVFKPQAVVLIDYPGFNLRIAKWFKARPDAD